MPLIGRWSPRIRDQSFGMVRLNRSGTIAMGEFAGWHLLEGVARSARWMPLHRGPEGRRPFMGLPIFPVLTVSLRVPRTLLVVLIPIIMKAEIQNPDPFAGSWCVS